jgi:hypothetical protein
VSVCIAVADGPFIVAGQRGLLVMRHASQLLICQLMQLHVMVIQESGGGGL